MNNVIKGLEGVVRCTQAYKAVLFGYDGDARVEVASWSEDGRREFKDESLVAFPIRKFDSFYGALCLINPGCMMRDAWECVKPGLEGHALRLMIDNKLLAELSSRLAKGDCYTAVVEHNDRFSQRRYVALKVDYLADE